MIYLMALNQETITKELPLEKKKETKDLLPHIIAWFALIMELFIMDICAEYQRKGVKVI